MKEKQTRFSALVKKAKAPLARFRQCLDEIRSHNPKLFDIVAELLKFLFPFIASFIPALFNSTIWIMIGCLVFSSAMYLTQWALLTNRQERAIHDEREKNKQTIQQIKNTHIKEIQELEQSSNQNNDTQIVVLENRIIRLTKISYGIASFSHNISDEIKRIIAEFRSPRNGGASFRVASFLQNSINTLEKLLSIYYETTICASIKVCLTMSTVKTYTRGYNNCIARGGSLRSNDRDKQPINILNNYAYKAIVKDGLKFFAEGDLTNIHNKVNDDDEFFCEYGEDYLDLFFATVVMPIRLPLFTRRKQKQETLGLLCVDCRKEMPIWSKTDFNFDLGYHIIADYADNLALLFKAFKNYQKGIKTI